MQFYKLRFIFPMFYISVVSSYKFPDNFKRCKVSDPNLDNCVKTAIQNAFQLIGTSGIPSLTLPPIEPIEVNSIIIGAGTTAIQLVQNYADVKILGFSKVNVESAHLDLNNKILTFITTMPRLAQEAKYEVNGKILIMPVYGKGDSTLVLEKAKIIHTIRFKEENKGSDIVFKVKSYELVIDIGGANYQFENLFDGDKLLSDNLHKVINENWKTLFEDIREGIQNSYGEVCKNIASRVFDTIPVAEIFLQ